MKRILSFTAFAVSALSLASCARPQPQPVVEHHYYHTTSTRYVPTRTTSASVPTYKPAGVSSNAPEAFQAVTPPSSYSR